jgi:L-2-hydroxyglutarate oxidase LhgO
MYSADCVVVGAGVVGLAVARSLSLRGRDVLVLESADRFGSGISSRNSEVIHAGIYYSVGSQKGALCLKGRVSLYDYCAKHAIAHRRCGKLIVATDDRQNEKLLALQAKGLANDVQDLELLDRNQALRFEPCLACSAALLSPSTGIIDSHSYMRSLLGEIERSGGSAVFRSPVVGGRLGPDGIVLDVGGSEPTALSCRTVINCAGLGAQRLAAGIEGLVPGSVPPLFLAKGNYFALAGKAPFSHLIYPLPQPGGLGVHLTLDLAGQARFGPDVEWVGDEDYEVDPHRGDAFYGEIRRYWPGLPDAALQPAYAGIRPKVVGPDGGDQDFIFQGPERHGGRGLISLFGIESPGLTASLAIGEKVADMAASE